MTEFSSTPDEIRDIHRIIDRAKALGFDQYSDLSLMMYLDACHSNGCPLDFAKLAEFGVADLIHDVAGITRHLDTATGQLQDCFLPRCAKPEPAA